MGFKAHLNISNLSNFCKKVRKIIPVFEVLKICLSLHCTDTCSMNVFVLIWLPELKLHFLMFSNFVVVLFMYSCLLCNYYKPVKMLLEKELNQDNKRNSSKKNGSRIKPKNAKLSRRTRESSSNNSKIITNSRGRVKRRGKLFKNYYLCAFLKATIAMFTWEFTINSKLLQSPYIPSSC